jgi:hypothetical protein
VGIFLQPVADETGMVLDILQLFGDASGLQTNVQKSNVVPIQCSDMDLAVIQEHLPCELQEFPSKYLGLPLFVRKLTKAQLQAYSPLSIG